MRADDSGDEDGDDDGDGGGSDDGDISALQHFHKTDVMMVD